MGSSDDIFLHGVGDKAALADVHEVSEMPADWCPKCAPVQVAAAALLHDETLKLFLGSQFVFLPVLIQCLGETWKCTVDAESAFAERSFKWHRIN